MNKIQKSKKEKPEQEEEMKVAQAKYEKTLQQLHELMESFSEREEQLLDSLNLFADAEIAYYQKGSQILSTVTQSIHSRPRQPVKKFSVDSLRFRSDTASETSSLYLADNDSKELCTVSKTNSAEKLNSSFEKMAFNEKKVETKTPFPVAQEFPKGKVLQPEREQTKGL